MSLGVSETSHGITRHLEIEVKERRQKERDAKDEEVLEKVRPTRFCWTTTFKRAHGRPRSAAFFKAYRCRYRDRLQDPVLASPRHFLSRTRITWLEQVQSSRSEPNRRRPTRRREQFSTMFLNRYSKPKSSHHRSQSPNMECPSYHIYATVHLHRDLTSNCMAVGVDARKYRRSLSTQR